MRKHGIPISLAQSSTKMDSEHRKNKKMHNVISAGPDCHM